MPGNLVNLCTNSVDRLVISCDKLAGVNRLVTSMGSMGITFSDFLDRGKVAQGKGMLFHKG